MKYWFEFLTVIGSLVVELAIAPSMKAFSFVLIHRWSAGRSDTKIIHKKNHKKPHEPVQ